MTPARTLNSFVLLAGREVSGRKHPGLGIWEEASGRRHLGEGIWGRIWEKASGRRHLGEGIWEEASGRRHLRGNIWEDSGKDFGRALGWLWEGSGKALGGALAALDVPGVAGMVSFHKVAPLCNRLQFVFFVHFTTCF